MTDTHFREAPREYCRRVLPLVSRTFAITIELLDDRMRDAVRVAYLLCRAADALEDSWPGSGPEVAGRFHGFLAALAGDADAAGALADAAATAPGERDDLRLVSHLPTVLAALAERTAEEQRIVREGVRTLATGMRRYASRASERAPQTCYLDDEGELADYCFVVAGCVGVMLTQLFERRLADGADPARARRMELAPVVGEALQLTNIALDLPGDIRRGRCYVPASWLAPHAISPADLVCGTRPEARAVALRLVAAAHGALDRVPDYIDTLPRRHVRYRLFCLWPALWARASLRLAEREPAFPALAHRVKLTRGALWSAAARSLLVAHSRRGVRGLLARD